MVVRSGGLGRQVRQQKEEGPGEGMFHDGDDDDDDVDGAGPYCMLASAIWIGFGYYRDSSHSGPVTAWSVSLADWLDGFDVRGGRSGSRKGKGCLFTGCLLAAVVG
ncbi:hypothetical protein MBM_04128 [Drepanopeziza brunnea f. sp. 'multigermtubi' MB_m1]|uniref:Uncharacterized protein n=1 Tax=Marssonina brunnea f. sp. multigermtubi (strain MB_m1) TaxID=1072389 RepID=K1XY78_MARBU|nr:uncharacterized protein MBM_04128 [Drepanopeziza brunnea f. sp. 'multigermtubi' MB_m1]EKD17759.1 hypothetical protein MBM_04128 [Drepanopeziza brunnea f. sp. 'multigermtubi' MB_m1]